MRVTSKECSDARKYGPHEELYSFTSNHEPRDRTREEKLPAFLFFL